MTALFVETRAFTRRVINLLSDDEYTALQWFLETNPQTGAVIRNTGGARKVRWGKQQQGKRGGLRIIYFHHEQPHIFWMLALYEKTEQADLSEQDKNIIKRLIEEIKT